jgi:UDP-N-acetylmuramoyl-L-alanyl-D-glutamate--2,6-diaminopimelate ligase
MTITMDSALESDFRIVELQATASGLAYTLRSAGEEIAIVTPFIGSHNAYNVGFAAMALRALGYASATITAAIAQVPVVPGRLEPVSNSRANVFVDYAHKPDALEKVLMFLRPVCQGRLISVFGCGGERDAGKRPIMGDLSARLADITVVTSDNPRSEDPNAIVAAILAGVAEPLRERLHIKMDRRQAIEYAIGIARPGDVVLIAGKGHEPYQEINGVKYPFSDTTVAQEALEKLKHL